MLKQQQLLAAAFVLLIPASAMAIAQGRTYDVSYLSTAGSTPAGTWQVVLDDQTPPGACKYDVEWASADPNPAYAYLFISELKQPGHQSLWDGNAETFFNTGIFLTPGVESDGFDPGMQPGVVTSLTCREYGSDSPIDCTIGFANGQVLELELATPTATPHVPTTQVSFNSASMWIGLANSDDVGLRVDLRAEVLVDNVVVDSAEVDNVGTGSSGFNNASLSTLSFAGHSAAIGDSSTLGIRFSARRTCFGGGHNSGRVRLWFNGDPIDQDVLPSRFGQGPPPASHDAGSRVSTPDALYYYLEPSFAAVGLFHNSARTFQDATVSSTQACPSRPFTSFGTWSGQLLQ
jgi:hypothetical protein